MIYFLNLSVFALAAILSNRLAPLLIGVAHRQNFLDYPHDRKAHAQPTPYIGGAILFIAFWVLFWPGMFLINSLYEYFNVIGAYSHLVMSKIPGIFLGSLIVFVLGLLDDKFDVPAGVKFIVQFIAAGVLVYLGLTVNFLAPLGWLGYGVTLVWIVLIMNSFNFIDSIDAHCAGIAFISCMAFLSLSLIIYQPILAFLTAVLGGALLGYLPYNFKPARTFLGDNGSLFLGYMLAAVTLLCSYRGAQYSIVTPFIPIFMFGVPIYDTVSVIVVRTFRGIPPWKGDRNHFAHRLVRLGMSDKIAVLVSYFIAFTLALVAILSTQVNTTLGKVLIAVLFASIIGIIAMLEYYAAMRIRLMEELGAQFKRRKEDLQAEENK